MNVSRPPFFILRLLVRHVAARLWAVGVLALVVMALGSCTKKPEKPNILVLLLDTTRADHLSFYGYDRPTSPVIDAFAKENLVCSYAVTAAPWTPPSVTSILSGLYVSSHGLMPPNGREEAQQASARLESNVDTLQKVLKGRGYTTAAVSPNPWISKDFGFDQNFDSFTFIGRARAEEVTKAGMAELDRLSADGKPFFLYMHYLDPHDPYDPPEAYRKLFSGPVTGRTYKEKALRNIGLYDGEIRYLDDWLGKLFSYLKEKGLYDDLTIVLVGDHGEQFYERGNHGHGNQLFNEEVHVPLIIKTGPDSKHKRIDFTVSTIDIYPTVLELLGIERPKNLQGVSLLHDELATQRGGVFSEIFRKYQQKAFVSFEGKKLIIGSTEEGKMLEATDPSQNVIGVFDRRADYQELAPLNDAALLGELQNEFRATYKKALENHVQSSGAGGKVQEDTLKQLESLGYLK